MSYVKNVWQNGDVITAEKLNNLEDGVASSGDGESNNLFIVPFEYDVINLEYTTSIEFSDILEALSDNKIIVGAIVNINNDSVVGCELSHKISPIRLALSAPISSFDFVFDRNVVGQASESSVTLYYVKDTITINDASELSVITNVYSIDATIFQN